MSMIAKKAAGLPTADLVRRADAVDPTLQPGDQAGIRVTVNRKGGSYEHVIERPEPADAEAPESAEKEDRGLFRRTRKS